MEKNSNQPDTEETSICTQCGEEFNQPLLAELHREGVIEEYFACPRCLTKVGEVERETAAEEEAVDVEEDEVPAEEPINAEEVKTEERQSCPYFMGYLKKREKGTSIPEGCLTCSRMIDCLSHESSNLTPEAPKPCALAESRQETVESFETLRREAAS